MLHAREGGGLLRLEPLLRPLGLQRRGLLRRDTLRRGRPKVGILSRALVHLHDRAHGRDRHLGRVRAARRATARRVAARRVSGRRPQHRHRLPHLSRRAVGRVHDRLVHAGVAHKGHISWQCARVEEALFRLLLRLVHAGHRLTRHGLDLHARLNRDHMHDIARTARTARTGRVTALVTALMPPVLLVPLRRALARPVRLGRASERRPPHAAVARQSEGVVLLVLVLVLVCVGVGSRSGSNASLGVSRAHCPRPRARPRVGPRLAVHRPIVRDQVDRTVVDTRAHRLVHGPVQGLVLLPVALLGVRARRRPLRRQRVGLGARALAREGGAHVGVLRVRRRRGGAAPLHRGV
mmetsp:Transcript_8913/g.20823  ORF Transcript_8913/g.20823 Transcript_8913/m.20823 type:complete len:351 (+) Transcript_8913:1054-2106(+)